jgi:NAD(P)H-flavin reductase
VGAGTGYAPLHAMAVEAFRAGSEVPRAVVLGARSARELLYVDVLARQRAAGAPLAVTATLSRPEAWWTGSVGHVQAHWERALGALEARAGAPARVYVCGPAAMVTAVRARALSLGLGSERVVTER